MLFAQVINNHTAGCGFAHAALAGDCNGMGSCHKKTLLCENILHRNANLEYHIPIQIYRNTFDLEIQPFF